MDQRVIDREIHGGFYTNLDSFEKHQVLSFAEHQIILPAMENETELLCSVETEGSGDTISIKGRPNLVRNIQIKAENHIEYNGEYGRIFTKPL